MNRYTVAFIFGLIAFAIALYRLFKTRVPGKEKLDHYLKISFWVFIGLAIIAASFGQYLGLN
ncbi:MULTISPECIES: hypothetical protein [Aerococcus]|uniref:Uncharacterized protein n=1 Tax=Aerococcus tenax TaxID=3078812 RepID=A0A5N1BMW6_9LACT|nr:hypothetical protein [Aerococcus urinae]KAA9241056.1 hypothetical protein F6I34_03830 [Aerococcus urinae]MDK6372288.1 hypothetical protein [Aerococcus urinae]MDK6596893.1 hypothetical protein [Aerococcus urinae]MDK7302356.1 hypothetical protein [Aerococcus urinae]MDK7800692.1 hypothetical protein [Aerococcus urinae]